MTLHRLHVILFPALMAALLLQFFAVWPAGAEVPALKSSVVSIDLPESYADAVRLEIDNGRFSDYSVAALVLAVQNIDFRNGTLQGMAADITGGEFDYLFVDTMAIRTDAFSFDTFQLLNEQRFVLDKPITGTVRLTVSEENLTRFIKHPRTVGKLEKAISKETGGLKLITFGNPEIDLDSGNRIRLSLITYFGGELAIPMEMEGQLALNEGTIEIQDLEVSTQKEKLPLPIDVVDVIEDELNDLIDLRDLAGKHFAIHASSLEMDRDALTVGGHAIFSRLSFGK